MCWNSFFFCIYLFLHLQATPATACPATSLPGNREVVVKPEVQRSHAAGSRSHSKSLCLGDLAECHGPVHPPTSPTPPHPRASLIFLEAIIPKGKHSVLGWRPRQVSGTLPASGQNMNLAGEEVSILVLGIGPGSAIWRMDPPRKPPGTSPEGVEVAGNSVLSSIPLGHLI